MSIINEQIAYAFVMRDNASTTITGLSTGSFATLEAYQLDDPGITAAATVTEIGAGEYRAEFTPSTAATWVIHIYYSSGGVNREFLQEYSISAAVPTETVFVPTELSGHALKDIRAAVARHCVDWVRFVATETSADTTVFIDDLNAYENEHHFRGSDLWFRNDTGTVANQGKIVRVEDSSQSDASLTLRSGLVSPVTIGDEAWGFNIGGMGNRLHTYDAIINDVILSLGEAGYPVYSEEISTVWDDGVTWWDIPETFTHVSTAQYQDLGENWNDIPSHAIAIDTVTKQFAISPEYAYYANGYDVKLLGRAKPSPLTDDDDMTNVDFEWLTYEAAAVLLLQDRSQLKVNKGGMMKNAADALRGKAGPLSLIEGMVRVR